MEPRPLVVYTFHLQMEPTTAYRQLREDPLDYPLLGIKHNNAYYIDICPSFGCRASGQAQQRVSNAVVYFMGQEDVKVLAYVDDFSSISHSWASAKHGFDRFHTLTAELGLRLAPEKTSPPATTMEWLGYLFNTVDMCITIPQEKLDDLLQEAEKWLHHDVATKQQIQSLAGRLNHVSMCVRPSRRFKGRIFATLSLAHEQTSVKVTDEFKKDVNWFCDFAKLTNRRILIEPKLPTVTIECDACLSGAGGFSDTHFYEILFPQSLVSGYHMV